jgi:hypothetical protein
LEYVDIGAPYLTCVVEFFEDDTENPEDIEPMADEVFDLFERIAKAAFKLSGSRGSFPEIPRTDPEKLSFLVTAAFNLDDDVKSKTGGDDFDNGSAFRSFAIFFFRPSTRWKRTLK